jgi:hypothetical protein
MNRQQPLGGELFEEGSLTAHRFGAASPFQPAQRILSRVCVGHDLDSRTQNLSAEPLPVLNLRHLHKVGDNLHFYYFSDLSVSNRGINRELVYSQLYIFNRLEPNLSYQSVTMSDTYNATHENTNLTAGRGADPLEKDFSNGHNGMFPVFHAFFG